MTSALVVLIVYMAWLGVYLGVGNDVRDFIGIGPAFVFRGDIRMAEYHPNKPRIGLDRGYRPSSRNNGSGYDGQFEYYLALRPRYARYYMDDPAYRYSRVLLPLVARLLALAQRHLVPYTLLLTNLLAAAVGTWALARWLCRRHIAPYFALLYGLFPGIFIGIQRDVSEPLAYALVAVGVLLLDHRGNRRLLSSAIVLALAGLARNTTIVFPIVLGLWLATGGEHPQQVRSRPERWSRASLFLLVSIGPCVAYWIFLRVWLGSFGGAGQLSPVPFLGIVHPPWLLTHQGVDVVIVAFPAVLAVAALVPRGSLRSSAWLPWLLLVSNVLLNVVFYRRFYTTTYISVARVATGVALSAGLCIPELCELPADRRTFSGVAAVLALAPLPVLAVQGFVSLSS